MNMASNKNAFERYPDGSKCAEYIADLTNSGTMTWEDIYWRAKYLYVYGRDLCTSRNLISYFNECFNQGLSVNANQELYMDTRKMQSALYIAEEDFKMASNCIQAILDITEDIPAEMFLDLTYAEIHTDLLRILKSPVLFFNDLHVADSVAEFRDRQKSVICRLLLKAAEAKSKSDDIAIDLASIEREVAGFGLTDSEEYVLFKKVLAGEAAPVIIPTPEPKPVVKTPAEPKQVEEAKPKSKTPKKRNAQGLLEIDIFGDEEKTESQPTVVKKLPASVPESAPEPQPVVPSSPDMKNIEAMLTTLMATVSENAKQISSLHGKIQVMSDDSEVAKIKAELEAGETRNQELLAQLAAANAQITAGEKQIEERERLLAESERQIVENKKQIEENQRRIAEKEKEQAELEEKIKAQNALLVAKKNAEFTEEELLQFNAFDRIIVIDTCAIEHRLDLLDYIAENEIVRISKTVVQELENHKKNRFDLEKSKMGQRALKAIRSRKATFSYDYEDCYTFLLPDALRIKEDDDMGTANDKEIFSVALRYKIHANIPVLIISDDTTMQVMAESEHINNTSAEDFIAGREKNVPRVSQEKLTKDQFLARKLKCNEYSLSQHEVMVLRNCGVETVGVLLEKTEEDLAFIRDKKGISYSSRFTQVIEKIKKHYSSLFE